MSGAHLAKDVLKVTVVVLDVVVVRLLLPEDLGTVFLGFPLVRLGVDLDAAVLDLADADRAGLSGRASVSSASVTIHESAP